MSIMELMHGVKEHIIFYKWDILQGLGWIASETVDWDVVVLWGHPITQPTTTDIRGTEANSAEAWEAHSATPSLFGPPPEEEMPPVKPIASPTADDVGHTPPGLANPPPEIVTTVLSTKPKMEDWPTGQDASPIEVHNSTCSHHSIGGQVNQPHHPIWPDWRGKTVCAGCDCFGDEAEFGSNQSCPQRHGDYLYWRSGLLEFPKGSSSPWTC